MGKPLRIKNWPFKKGEVVRLHWIRSPWRAEDRQWTISVDFRRATGIVEAIKLPWGLLPALRIGGAYVDGELTQPIDGHYGKVSLCSGTVFEICKLSEIPTMLQPPYLFPEYQEENVCRFIADETEYFLPCIEVVRMYLTPTTVLANALTSAGGLEALYYGVEIEDRKMHIDLSLEYPSNLASEKYMLHLAWLLSTPENRATWNCLRNQLINFSDSSAHAISTVPPELRWTTIAYRGAYTGKQCLIQSITALEGLLYPNILEISYTHPQLVHKEIAGYTPPRKTDDPLGKRNTELMASDSETYADHSKAVRIATSASTQYRFMRKPAVTRHARDTRKVNKRQKDKNMATIPGGRGSETAEESVTGSERGTTGGLPPVDFDLLDRVSLDAICGLEAFIRFILSISYKQPGLNLQLSIFYLPAGETISLCRDGTIRQAAIVQITGVHAFPGYVIEIGRPDDWKISTLVIQLRKKDAAVDKRILAVLDSMFANYGHWNESEIQTFFPDAETRLFRHRKAKGLEPHYTKLAEFFRML